MTEPKMKITVVNAYGRVVPNTKAHYHKKDASGRPLRVEISAPGYLTYSFWRFLEATQQRVYMLTMDPDMAKGPSLIDACWYNLTEAMKHTQIGGCSLARFINSQPLEKHEDRTYFHVYRGSELINSLDRSGSMRRASFRFHDPHEEGYEIVGSWKTTRGAPYLQITLWQKPPSGDNLEQITIDTLTSYVAELDFDLSSGLGHASDFIKHTLTGGVTNAYLVNQALAWSWGVTSFLLRPQT